MSFVKFGERYGKKNTLNVSTWFKIKIVFQINLSSIYNEIFQSFD